MNSIQTCDKKWPNLIKLIKLRKKSIDNGFEQNLTIVARKIELFC